MTEPFDQHDATIHRIAMYLLQQQQKGTHMHKGMSESVVLLENALKEWQPNCPGAGWEHHNTQALVTLAQTPAMQELMRLAAVGAAAESGSDLEELRHVADRIYPTNPQYNEVQQTFAAAVRAQDLGS